MKWMLCLTCLAFTLSLSAADKPNTLSNAEIADGWLLLFDGESKFGLTTDGTVAVKEGVLQVGGKEKASVQTKPLFGTCNISFQWSEDKGETWHDFSQQLSTMEEVASPNGSKMSFEKGVLSFSSPDNQGVWLRSIKLQPADSKSLFNGKDLTGWKVFPGAKDRKVASVYSVTKEGDLNVTNGPGDLQTEEQWADFIVQFDCLSNGKHLNSGLFFRCLPGLYQQGYEAQIRNEWIGDDRKKPVDFGTGAIYRRIPARQVVSTDGEWFTMTVAAKGKEIATWVNGFPVVSWTDDRKDNDNARQGAKTTKGALSIQGHDPTTNLSFRKIRVQSLDK
jgi:hypothetical protein